MDGVFHWFAFIGSVVVLMPFTDVSDLKRFSSLFIHPADRMIKAMHSRYCCFVFMAFYLDNCKSTDFHCNSRNILVCYITLSLMYLAFLDLG